MRKKIIFCGGGTGGHIFPSLSLYNFFNKKGYVSVLLTDERGIKYFKENLLDCKVIKISSFGPGTYKKIFFYLKLFKAFVYSFFFLIREKPNFVFGLGGYVAFPICLAAKILNIKILLYEPNMVLGRVNKFFIRFCEKIFVNSDKIINLSPKYKIKCNKVGNILRDEILKHKSSKQNYLNKSKTILVLGGSQGAEIFGNIVPRVILDLSKEYKINIIQQTIPEQVNNIRNIYDNNNIKNNVFNFHTNIFELISKADLAISRCGASTLGELEFLAVPFIAIPYPFAKDDHQYQNAVYYERKGCCWILNQKNFTFDGLKEVLIKILNDNEGLNLKRKNMLKNDSEKSLPRVEAEIRKLI